MLDAFFNFDRNIHWIFIPFYTIPFCFYHETLSFSVSKWNNQLKLNTEEFKYSKKTINSSLWCKMRQQLQLWTTIPLRNVKNDERKIDILDTHFMCCVEHAHQWIVGESDIYQLTWVNQQNDNDEHFCFNITEMWRQTDRCAQQVFPLSLFYSTGKHAANKTKKNATSMLLVRTRLRNQTKNYQFSHFLFFSFILIAISLQFFYSSTSLLF